MQSWNMDNDVHVYNSYGKKYEVPRRRLKLFAELLIGDHIAFHRHCGSYWHHAIIEEIHSETGTLDIIEYSNTVEGFWNDNSGSEDSSNSFSLPIAKVMRRSWRPNFQGDHVYLVVHTDCSDPAIVIYRARSKLGDANYSPIINNCEHFAMWCKTGKQSSDQIKKAFLMMKDELFGGAVKNGIKEATEEVATGGMVKAAAEAIVKMTNEAAKTGGKRVASRSLAQTGEYSLKTGVEEAVKKTTSKAGKGVLTTNSAALGLACGAVCEGISVLSDIGNMYKDLLKGQISKKEFRKVAKMRAVTGAGNLGGSTIGMAIGQAVIPVPFVGGLVGSVGGGLAGSFLANMGAYAAFE